MNKVLHISARSDIGGGPKHILDLLEGARGGWESFVAAPDEDALSDIFRRRSAAFFSLPHRRFSIISFVFLAIWAFRLHINLVHSHGRGAGIYSRLLGLVLRIPVVHTHHGLYLENSIGVKRVLLVFLERILNILTWKIIFVSQSELSACRSVGAFSAHKSLVIPNGVKLPLPVARQPHSRPLKLLAISRLALEKNNEDLIRVVSACQKDGMQLQLRIAGDGPERCRLERLVEDLQLKGGVEFLGNRTDIQTLICESDVYITASLGEAHSIAMLEAMAGGLPVVATNVRGHCDVVVDGENGYLFDLRDYTAAVQILKKFSSHRTHLIQCGDHARQMVEKQFSQERMLASIFNIYNSIK